MVKEPKQSEIERINFQRADACTKSSAAKSTLG
jgi:hypothetical protein